MKNLSDFEILQVSGGLYPNQITYLVAMGATALTHFMFQKHSKLLQGFDEQCLKFLVLPAAQILATGISNEVCNQWFEFKKKLTEE